MKKSFLIQYPEVFQGENKLQVKEYFEGWYFKNTCDHYHIAFIPGIHIENGIKKAFIQIVTPSDSYYVSYDFKEFSYSDTPFCIRIGNTIFSKDSIHLNLYDPKQLLQIEGELFYSNSQPITTSKYAPTIMGPFSYLSFMECNHAVIDMKNTITGSIRINGTNYDLTSGNGYIEKDWGTSFPKEYVWCQANTFSNPLTSLFLSVAHIPFKGFSFTGFICSFFLNAKEYRFATYNHSKLVKYEVTNNSIAIVLKHKEDTLSIFCSSTNGLTLKAPVKGNMQKDILETIDATIKVTLSHHDTVLYTDISNHCGLEIVL